jgi:hypothetical protein
LGLLADEDQVVQAWGGGRPWWGGQVVLAHVSKH